MLISKRLFLGSTPIQSPPEATPIEPVLLSTLRALIQELDYNSVAEMLGRTSAPVAPDLSSMMMPPMPPSMAAPLMPQAPPSLAACFPPQLGSTFGSAVAPDAPMPPAIPSAIPSGMGGAPAAYPALGAYQAAGAYQAPAQPLSYDPATPVPQKDQLKKYDKDGWLANHGQYKHVGDEIDMPDGKRAVPVPGGNPGEFDVLDENGKSLGIYTSPKVDANWQPGQHQIDYAAPLIFDVDGDGKVGTTNTQDGQNKDMDGDGKADFTAWAKKGDGVLAFGNGADGKSILDGAADIDGDGKPDGYASGFDALAALAKKYLGPQALADGKLDQNEIKQLEDKANLHLIVDGKDQKLSEAGIKEISLRFLNGGKGEDVEGNQHRLLGSFTRTDGRQGHVDDVWLRQARSSG